MKLKVRLDFNDEQRQLVMSFVDQLNRGKDLRDPEYFTVEQFCRRAILYAINDAYRRAEEAQKNGTHNTETRNVAGDSPESESFQGTNSNPLSDESNSSHQSE